MERLTSADYWDEQWLKRSRARPLRLRRDFDYETVRLLQRNASGKPVKVIELGAGGSRVLPYLAAKFGYRVFGSDFSERGCKLLRANLSAAGAEGCVVREDIFQSSLQPGQFDLAFSCGLIEHFSDFDSAIEQHLRLVRPGGRVVLIVPNLQGLHGAVVKRLAPALWRRHRAIGPAELHQHLHALGATQIQSGYLGSFFFQIGTDHEWAAVQRWPWPARHGIHAAVRMITASISLTCRLLPARPHSRIFSTGIFACGTRPER